MSCVPHPDTLASIALQQAGPPGAHPCGCELRVSNARGQQGRTRWYLCQYHEGFNDAADRPCQCPLCPDPNSVEGHA